MSTTSIRRIKERGGAGGKITASIPTKNLTPLSEKPSLGSTRKSVGKENPNPNPRSISRVSGFTQKPAIRPMPRMFEGEPKSRPRGRSPSPSDFTRILSDFRKTRVSTSDTLNRSEVSNGGLVGSGGKGLNGFRVLERKGLKELNPKVCEKGVNGFRLSTDGKENANLGEKSREFCEKNVAVERKICNARLSDEITKGDNLCVNSVKPNVSDVDYAVDSSIGHCDKDGSFMALDNVIAHQEENGNKNVVLKANSVPNMEKAGSMFSFKGSNLKNTSSLKGSEVCKEKGVNDEGTGVRVGNKHASKLHEKLAYLEGKVKRIASDIKKTKEMLDMNNTDASKVILSDIQEKISGIEKAMGNVITGSNSNPTADFSSNLGNSNHTDIDTIPITTHEIDHNKQDDITKVSVKGLSCEELEARLFPHHKLLKNRTLLKLPTSGSQSDGTHVSESYSGSSSVENSTSPIGENPIEIEFLASLSKVESQVSATNTEVPVDGNEVQKTRPSSGILGQKYSNELDLLADERFDEFDDQENKPVMIVVEEMEDNSTSQLREIGRKISTGGWFVSEGESVLLAHGDGSCSFYDIANDEEKAEYRPPSGISQSLWRDCWIIRAPSADGCSGKYVVAASAGCTMDSGFCSWDFYSKDIRAFHVENNTPNTRAPLGPLRDNIMYRRNTLSSIMSSENQQWWYRPCGPLIISTATCQKSVKIYDIRDGEQIMKWDVQKPVLSMDYSSPLQWRNRGKVVIAEIDGISLWDVSSLNSQALLSVSTSGRSISALHVNNTDAELGGGVRQRVSSSEAEGNDGVFCTDDSINVLDFRQPSGIALKTPKIGLNVESISSRGDSIFLGCNNVTSAIKKQVCSQVLEFSIRKQRIVNTYVLPESNAHSHHKALTQVWGNSNQVMAVCGLGLFVFDTLKNDGLPSFATDYSSPQKAKEVIGPDDLYSPSFDYMSSQILLISRDRPAMWTHLSQV